MRWQSILPAFVLLGALIPGAAPAFQAASFGFGVGTEGVDTFRVEVQQDLGWRWLESETGFLALSIDGAVDYWFDGSEDAFAFSAAPFLTYEFRGGRRLLPFIEAGVGATYTTKTRIGGQNLGMNFQFEDIIGVGFRLGERKKHGFRFRALHYSNANLDSDNDGLTFFTASYHYRF